MHCEECRLNIDDYRRGMLGDPVRQEFERHLATCPACAAELDLAEQLGNILKSAGHHMPPDSYFEDLQARAMIVISDDAKIQPIQSLKRSSKRSAGFPFRGHLLEIAALMIVGMIGALVLIPLDRAQEKPSTTAAAHKEIALTTEEGARWKEARPASEITQPSRLEDAYKEKRPLKLNEPAPEQPQAGMKKAGHVELDEIAPQKTRALKKSEPGEFQAKDLDSPSRDFADRVDSRSSQMPRLMAAATATAIPALPPASAPASSEFGLLGAPQTPTFPAEQPVDTLSRRQIASAPKDDAKKFEKGYYRQDGLRESESQAQELKRGEMPKSPAKSDVNGASELYAQSRAAVGGSASSAARSRIQGKAGLTEAINGRDDSKLPSQKPLAGASVLADKPAEGWFQLPETEPQKQPSPVSGPDNQIETAQSDRVQMPSGTAGAFSGGRIDSAQKQSMDLAVDSEHEKQAASTSTRSFAAITDSSGIQSDTTGTAGQLLLDAEDSRLSGRYEQAIQLYEHAIRSHPNSEIAAKAWVRIGDISFENLRDPLRARRAYQLALNPPLRDYLDSETIRVLNSRLSQPTP